MCQLKLHTSWLDELLLCSHFISIFIHYSIILLIINQSHINYKHSIHSLQLLCTLLWLLHLDTCHLHMTTECTLLFAIVQHLLIKQFNSNITSFTLNSIIINDVGLYKFLMSAVSSAFHCCAGCAVLHCNSLSEQLLEHLCLIQLQHWFLADVLHMSTHILQTQCTFTATKQSTIQITATDKPLLRY